MATKSKRRKKRHPVSDLFQQAQRSFSKRDFKQALKNAKLCYRQEPSDEHGRFFQRACLARARELHRLGMRDECRSVLETLLDLGVTEPSVKEELPQLLIAVGMFDRSGAGQSRPDIDADSPLLASAADHAVVRPEEASASLAGIREGAQTIRAVLRALESGDESEVFARLKDVGRNSPFADWKYFIRGLAAYYRQDGPETLANWDRLDPARFAAQITAPLRVLADPASADRNDRHVKGGIGKIAAHVLGGPILTHLYDLRTHLAADRWKNALGSLCKSREPLRRLNPDLLGRIAGVLYSAILRKGSRSRMDDLASVADPLPMDPHWNRARAILWEHPENHDVREAEKCWLCYLDDLAAMECLSEAEASLAQALVWERIGLSFVREREAASRPFGWSETPPDELEARATEYFDNALRWAPNLLSAYEALAAAQIDWKEPEKAAETFRRLLEHFPENLDALLFLAQHHVRRDEPLRAGEYARQAHRLKPANKVIAGLLWSAHVGSARHYALRNEWEEGRAEFEAADKLNPSARDAYHLLARKAIFELRARDFALGEQLAEQAQSQAAEPTPALLVLAVEAIRYDLSRTARSGFQRQWEAALKKRCCSQTAGLMSMALTAYLVVEVDYSGRRDHVKHLLAYVRRCSHVKWAAGDLRNVCTFLETLAEQAEFSGDVRLLGKLVRKGLKKFPQEPAFHVMAGELEIAKGPAMCNRPYAQKCFQAALELAKSSNEPGTAAVVERAKRKLTFLGEVGLEPFEDYCDVDDDEDDEDNPFAGPMPSGFFGPDFDPHPDVSPGELFGIFVRACSEMGLDPEEVLDRMATDGPFRVRRPPKSRSRSKRKKKKR
ncbi:MAG: hypothetical protein ABIP48_22995 [Planctomycetota bacterium]